MSADAENLRQVSYSHQSPWLRDSVRLVVACSRNSSSNLIVLLAILCGGRIDPTDHQ